MKRRRPRRPTAEWEVIPRTECPGGFPSLAKVDQNRLGVLIFDKKKTHLRTILSMTQWLCFSTQSGQASNPPASFCIQ